MIPAKDPGSADPGSPAHVLLIGGGVFLGWHLADAFVRAGHLVTTFHRGVSSSRELPPTVRVIHGDRDSPQDLAALADTQWDVIVDTCGYLPHHVRLSATALDYRRYIYISSISVYESFRVPPTETSKTLSPVYATSISGSNYGAAKVACEETLAAHVSAPALMVRCGLMTGPRDVSSAARYTGQRAPADLAYDEFAGRLPYWPWRFLRPGTVLLPGDPQAMIQVLDARDLAAWLADPASAGLTGAVNVVGEAHAFGDWINACLTMTDYAGPPPQWVSTQALLAAGLRPRLDLPLWNPPEDGAAAFFAVDASHAHAHGLRSRPLSETVRDLVRWIRQADRDSHVVGEQPLSAERESRALGIEL